MNNNKFEGASGNAVADIWPYPYPLRTLLLFLKCFLHIFPQPLLPSLPLMSFTDEP